MALLTTVYRLHGHLDDRRITLNFSSSLRDTSGGVQPEFVPAATLSMEYLGKAFTFTGDEIRSTDSAIGTLLSVPVEIVVDVATTFVSFVVLPAGRLSVDDGSETEVHLAGIRSVLDASFARPGEQGPDRSSASSFNLSGTVRALHDASIARS